MTQTVENYGFKDLSLIDDKNIGNETISKLMSSISNGIWIIIEGHNYPCRILDIDRQSFSCLVELFEKGRISSDYKQKEVNLSSISGIYDPIISLYYESLRKQAYDILSELPDKFIDAINDLYIFLETIKKFPEYNFGTNSKNSYTDINFCIAEKETNNHLENTIDSIKLLEQNKDKYIQINEILDFTYKLMPKLKVMVNVK